MSMKKLREEVAKALDEVLFLEDCDVTGDEMYEARKRYKAARHQLAIYLEHGGPTYEHGKYIKLELEPLATASSLEPNIVISRVQCTLCGAVVKSRSFQNHVGSSKCKRERNAIIDKHVDRTPISR